MYNAELDSIQHSETVKHLDNVKEYTEKLLNKYNEINGNSLTQEYIELVVRGSYLHDIGKVGIPERILYKKGPLTDNERVIVETHPLIGAYMIEKKYLKNGTLNEEFEITKNIVKYHHEKWDGSGYPERLKAEEIPFEARVVTIVDIYDALTSERCYKEPWSHEEALAYIKKEKEKSFDPMLVEAFLNI